jgi:hypothetical protein
MPNEAQLYISRYRGLATIFRLLACFTFRDHVGVQHTVPEQFETDGASFPWWLRFVPSLLMLVLLAWTDPVTAFIWATAAQAFVGFPIHSAYTDAAVAHDYLYSIGARKLYADRVLFELIIRRACALYRMSRRRPLAIAILAYRFARAGVMYAAVVALGWPAYWSHARRRRLRVVEKRSV